MTKEQKLETKIDLLFGVMANHFLADQAMKLYGTIQEKMTPEDEKNESIVTALEKSAESYKHHIQNVNDAIGYYYELFGEESNANIVSLLKEKGYKLGEDESPAGNEEVGKGCDASKVSVEAKSHKSVQTKD